MHFKSTVLAALVALVVASPAAADRFTDAQQLRADTHRDHRGTGDDCYVVAYDLYWRLQRAGIEARLVIVQATMLNLFDSHSFVEVRKQGRWVIQDPTFDGDWRLNGRLVGTGEIQAVLRKGIWPRVRWHGPQAAIRAYYADPRLLFRYARFRQWNAASRMTETRSTVPGLHAIYYAQKKRPPSSVAGLVVRTRGGTANGYELAQLPDSRWISPIHFLRGDAAVVRDGQSILWVRRYR